MTEIERALDELRVAADVCELDENQIVVGQSVRIRSARTTLQAAITTIEEERVGGLAGDPAQTHNDLWQRLVDMIIEWEDSGHTAGDLARQIIAALVLHDGR